MAGRILYTIGHSTRTLERFLELLEREGVQRVADVRRFPMSRRLPHFNREALAESLRATGIEYVHVEAMGGRREHGDDLPPTGWRVGGFHAYAHYMATPPFRSALDRVLALAAERRTTVMCAEAVPWRCHRNLIADAATARGCEVRHIMDAGVTVHQLTSFASVEDGDVVYREPAAAQASLFDALDQTPPWGRRRRAARNDDR